MTQTVLLIVQNLASVMRNILDIDPSVFKHTILIVMIFLMLFERWMKVDKKITKTSDEEIKREIQYDFENAAQHIIEWFRHSIRAPQQNAAKNEIISEMKNDEAF